MINQSPIRKVDYGHDIESIEEAIDTFVAATDAPDDVSEQFADVVKGMADTIGELQEENDQLQSENDELDEENDELHEEVDRLEKELADQREESAKDRANIRQRITEVEEKAEDTASEGESAGVQSDRTTRQNPNYEPETALEDIVQLPSHVADESLSANQERSRFVAKDVHQYSRSVPAGRAIKSSEVRRILAASEEGNVHTQTVSRVLGMLDDLGEDEVEIKERRDGERVVIFSDEFVKRIVAWQNSNHGVVVSEEVPT